MFPGPQPKATALRLLEGDLSKGKKLRDGEPSPPPVVSLKPPASITAAGRKIWKQYAPSTEACGLLTQIDVPLFAIFCNSLAEYQEADKQIAELVPTLSPENSQGHYAHQTMMTARSQSWARVQALADRFGFTPAARARFGSFQKADESGIKKFLKKAAG